MERGYDDGESRREIDKSQRAPSSHQSEGVCFSSTAASLD